MALMALGLIAGHPQFLACTYRGKPPNPTQSSSILA
jgi:hypothetical protein